MKIKILTIVSCFALFVILVFSQGLKTNKVYDTKDLIGKPISEVSLNLLNKDISINTKDLKENNFTLINFWASWCAPCKREHKYLMKLSKNKNLKILGINVKDKKTNANKFINELGNPYYLIAKDYDGKSSVYFGVYGIPETILIDKNLIIIKKVIGPLDNNDVKEILKVVKKNEVN